MFYGQFGEEKFINTIFPDKTDGICIEVGAYDGRSLSNTLHYEQKGWRALCIEPIPEAFQKCKKIRKECYQCCVGENDSDDIDFTIFHLNDNLCAISSLVPDKRLIESHKHLITNVSNTKVKVRSLTSLLDELNFPLNIDFISIDTENTEFDVLKGININKYNIKLFVIENNYNESMCETYLNPYGYKKINRIGVNDFYLKEQYCQITTVEDEPKPLTYLSGGRLGDLIQNLSVINENFYKTGRKGILYISDSNDKFEFDIKNTYNDTNSVISSQRYIKTYKIHANEQIDINLNDWRLNPLLFRQNFCNTYSQTYNIEWGKHQWITVPLINYALKDKILINVSISRFKNIDYNQFKTKYGEENLIFICFDKNQYTNFINKTNLNIKCMHVKNFNELCIAINSCKLFIGCQSMPLALTNALFHDSIILLDLANNKNNPNDIDLVLHENFNVVFKNVIDII
jgi:FkbM family methyltransferase